jgi:hypothetical protein
MAQFWADLSGGAANPRVRRTQEMAIQLRQQMAAMQLREYHNEQVGRAVMCAGGCVSCVGSDGVHCSWLYMPAVSCCARITARR